MEELSQSRASWTLPTYPILRRRELLVNLSIGRGKAFIRHLEEVVIDLRAKGDVSRQRCYMQFWPAG
jgi:hypothetical protein